MRLGISPNFPGSLSPSWVVAMIFNSTYFIILFALSKQSYENFFLDLVIFFASVSSTLAICSFNLYAPPLLHLITPRMISTRISVSSHSDLICQFLIPLYFLLNHDYDQNQLIVLTVLMVTSGLRPMFSFSSNIRSPSTFLLVHFL